MNDPGNDSAVRAAFVAAVPVAIYGCPKGLVFIAATAALICVDKSAVIAVNKVVTSVAFNVLAGQVPTEPSTTCKIAGLATNSSTCAPCPPPCQDCAVHV